MQALDALWCLCSVMLAVHLDKWMIFFLFNLSCLNILKWILLNQLIDPYVFWSMIWWFFLFIFFSWDHVGFRTTGLKGSLLMNNVIFFPLFFHTSLLTRLFHCTLPFWFYRTPSPMVSSHSSHFSFYDFFSSHNPYANKKSIKHKVDQPSQWSTCQYHRKERKKI